MRKRNFILLLLIIGLFGVIFIYKKMTKEEELQTITDIKYENLEESIDFSTYTKQMIDLNTSEGATNVKITENNITITSGGIYEFTGDYSGTMIVDAKGENVNIILNDVTLESIDGPALYIKKAKFVLLTIEGDNDISDTSNYTKENQEFNGTIYSTADLVIEGTGSLKIDANYEDGIVSKETLKINSGIISINAVGDGIRGKDNLIIKDGNITINAEGDGMKSTNTEDSNLGYILIENGAFDITALQDGIQAETSIVIKDGTFNLKTGGGSSNSSNNNTEWSFWGKNNYENSDTTSAKGIKAKTSIWVAFGTFVVDSFDDSLHSNGNIQIDNGIFTLSSGDDGIHADNDLIINSGTIDITDSYEGLEGTEIRINGGNISIMSSDDGINAAGGSNTTSENATGPRRDTFSSSTGTLHITGGMVYVNADGDGLDSNGNIEMSGGNIIVEGPINSGNGALDYDGTFKMTGGSLLALGSAGMDEAPSNNSTQYTLHFNISTKNIGSTIIITDSDGNEILNHTSNKQYSSIVFSSSDIIKDNTYTLWTDDTEIAKVTATDIITKYGSSLGGMMSNKENRPGGMRR